MHPQIKRFFWSVLAGFSTLLLIGMVALLTVSCMSFEKAKGRYAKNVADTTFTTVRTVIPRDSAVLRIVTDTTTVVHEIRQGRARIIYQRDPHMTTIQANCDSVVIEKKVPVYITKQVWGVDPVYKDRSETWRTVAFVLMGLIGAGVIAYLFTYRLKLAINKR